MFQCPYTKVAAFHTAFNQQPLQLLFPAREACFHCIEGDIKGFDNLVQAAIVKKAVGDHIALWPE